MGKTKEVKTASKAKSEVKPPSNHHAAITNQYQVPVKAAKAAKVVVTKPVNGKKAKKAATPSSDSSDSESDSEESASSASESESEAEVKPKAKAAAPVTNGKASKKAEVESSESSDSSDSSDEASDNEDSDSDSGDSEKSASDSDDSSDSDSEEKAAPVAKKVEKVAKVTKESSEEDSDDSDDSEDDKEGSDSDSDDSSESEKEAPSKKRKADDEPVAATKKAKTETPAGGEDTGSKNLFVGNLSWNIDDEWLYREFEEFGEISGARVISDKATGRSKGFGYVEFTNSADAAAALKAKKGALIDGREANVDFSTPRDTTAPKERAGARAQQYGDSQNPPSDTLFLGNLSFEADENMVGEAFGAHGTVTNVRLPTDMETGNPKGFGYVSFSSIDDAKAAYEAMTGAEIGGRPVRLDYATPRPENGGGGRGGGRGGRGGFGDRGGRGGGRGGRGGFGDRGGRGGARGGARGGRGGSTNRGGFGDFQGKKMTF
ncbi:hypothetical protein BP5796_11891 [Coleophoma crateriformis]|uniref:RRM domain-containing protein n=1 Tax=Coleophoma crateriformis TaxID=565419 RepID=A0A3D8QEN2_9HELO|nr:hypothetical protein BP5796_11891 [Coleophoma crateriformis]